MPANDNDPHKKRIINQWDEDTDDSGEEGSTGQGSGIQFRDFLQPGSDRDDRLPPDEAKRLLVVHQDIHEDKVKKQKEIREQRKALKEGKISLKDFRQGLQAGNTSQYLANPILARSAQFSGTDRQVSLLPTENIAETNDAKKEELQYQNELKNRMVNTPKFNPKPQFPR